MFVVKNMPPKRLKAKAPAKPASKVGEARKTQAPTSDSQQPEDDSDSSVYSDLGSEEDDSSELDESASEADEGDISSQDENEGYGTDDESGDEFIEEPDDVEQQTDDESENEESTKMKFVGGNEDDFLLGKKQKFASKTPKAEPCKRSSEAVKQEDAQIESSGSKVDEYVFDSSDEEDVRNTVGNIPMEWYEHYPHIGYDLDGKPILKPPRGNELDEFLRRMDDPDYWRTVKDKSTGQNVVLSDEDVDLIQRLQQGRYPSATYDPYEPFEDIFSHEKMIHPVTSHPPQKRSFVPSKIEKQMVSRMVHAIKMGWIKPRVKRDDPSCFSLLWDKDDEDTPNDRMQRYIPAPKMKLPGHEESYNPPPEYLFTKEEEEKWQEQEPEERLDRKSVV